MTPVDTVARRKRSMVVDLLARINRGRLTEGTRIPSLSVLGREFQLSKASVADALQPLIDDGTLVVHASVGIFVGATTTRAGRFTIVCSGTAGNIGRRVTRGFVDRIGSLGGTAQVMLADQFRATPPWERSAIPGLFCFTAEEREDPVEMADPVTVVVRYLGGDGAVEGRALPIDLDNVEGGRLAARELVSTGHREVAFLGLHRPGSSQHPWSRQRSDGWRSVMRGSLPRVAPIEILPTRDFPQRDRLGPYRQVAAQAAAHHERFSACVGADDLVITMFLDELRARNVPRDRWPAMVGFEGHRVVEPYVVNSVRPHWTGLGSGAAEILFHTARGRHRPALELVSMELPR